MVISNQTDGFYRQEIPTSALATPQIVGRESERKKFHKIIMDLDKSYVVFLTAKGGFGKTFFLRDILEKPGVEEKKILCPQFLIDLYHSINRTPEGFIRAVYEALSDADKEEFENYMKERITLDIMRTIPPPNRNNLNDQYQKMIDAFIKDLNRVGKTRRIIIPLDTVEYLFYESHILIPDKKYSSTFTTLSQWLITSFFPEIKNVVFLLAGRPGSKEQIETLTSISGKTSETIHIEGLSEQETIEYHQSLCDKIEQSEVENNPYLKSIKSLTEENIRKIFWALSEKGEVTNEYKVRPIALSIAIPFQYLLAKSQIYNKDISDLKKLTDADRQKNVETLIHDFGQYLRTASDEHFYLVVELANFQKGANPKLLAYDFTLEETEKLVAHLKSEEFPITFIKRRVEDDRLFLHDEIYDGLQEHFLDNQSARKKERVFTHISRYYKDIIDEIKQELAVKYSGFPEERPDSEKVENIRQKYRDAVVERVHYSLRNDLDLGYVDYRLNLYETILSNDMILAIQLQTELISTLLKEKNYAEKVGNTDRVAKIDHLIQVDYPQNAKIWWIKWFIIHRNSTNAFQLIEAIETSEEFENIKQNVLEYAHLQSWKATAFTYRQNKGDLKKAYALLGRELFTSLEKYQPKNEAETNLRNSILAQAYHNRGYLDRVRGNFISAKKYYTLAKPYWRVLIMEESQANTLNNLAFVLARLGNFGNARRHIKEAKNLRLRLGQPLSIALSEATFTGIEIYSTKYQEAFKHAERALKMAMELHSDRIEGLVHLHYAALRRFSAEPQQTSSLTKREKSLNESLLHSKRALEIFPEYSDETEHHIQGLLELGTTLREFIHLPESPDHLKYKEAVRPLEHGMELAKKLEIWVLYLDAALALAWMYYYAHEKTELGTLLARIHKTIDTHLSEYQIRNGKIPYLASEWNLGVFFQFARLHILYGNQDLDIFQKSDQLLPSDDLSSAIGNFTIAFEYFAIIGDDFREVRRAENIILSLFMPLANSEMTYVFEAIQETAKNVLGGKAPEELLFWNILEDNFGHYEIYKQTTNY